MPEISENTQTMHDRLFKEFMRRFLPDFLRLFFPEKAEQLDLDTLYLPEKELSFNLPGQVLRISDVVADVKTLTGEPEVIIVHVEVEARNKKTLPQRMFEYYSLLRILRQEAVLPLALVLLPRADGLGWQTYRENLFGEELVKFRYGQVGLRDLPGQDYLALGDPVAAGLAALMKFKPEEKARAKLTGLKTVVESNLGLGDKHFLVNLIQTYLPKEDVEVEGIIEGGDLVMEALADIELSWAEKIEQQGEIKGELKGKRNMLLYLLRSKFGALPPDFTMRLNRIQSDVVFDDIAEQLLTAQSLAEITWPEGES